jgi:hypothetical protein
MGLEHWYLIGYKNAADLLLDAAKSAPELFVPGVGACRHYIEIHLKHLLDSLRLLQVIPVTEEDMHGHELDKLWEKTRHGLVTKWPDSTDELDEAGGVIMDFHRVDQSGQESRYAVWWRKREKKESLEALRSPVSVTRLAEATQRLHGLLQGFDNALCDAIVERGDDLLGAELDAV